MIQAMPQADPFGVAGGQGPALILGPALVVERHLNVLHDSELLDEIVGLENETQPGAPNGRQSVVVELRHILSAEVIVARGGPVKTTQQVQHR